MFIEGAGDVLDSASKMADRHDTGPSGVYSRDDFVENRDKNNTLW